LASPLAGVSRRPGAKRTHRELFVGVNAENEDGKVRPETFDLLHHVETIAVWQVHVEDHHIPGFLGDQPANFRTGPRLTQRRDVAAPSEDRPEAGSDDRMIVRDEDADHLLPCVSRMDFGMRADPLCISQAT